MTTYIVECSCGHDLSVDADSRGAAIAELKEQMNEGGIKDHYDMYHQGEKVPSVQEVHAHIEADIKEAATV